MCGATHEPREGKFLSFVYLAGLYCVTSAHNFGEKRETQEQQKNAHPYVSDRVFGCVNVLSIWQRGECNCEYLKISFFLERKKKCKYLLLSTMAEKCVSDAWPPYTRAHNTTMAFDSKSFSECPHSRSIEFVNGNFPSHPDRPFARSTHQMIVVFLAITCIGWIFLSRLLCNHRHSA